MNKHIETLIQLAKDNPELEIITMVEYEVCCGDDYAYWMGKITKVEKDIVWQNEEHVLIGESDIEDELELYLDNNDIESTDEKIQEEFDKLKREGKIKETIIIFVGV